MFNVIIDQDQDTGAKTKVTYITSCFGTRIYSLQTVAPNGTVISSYRGINILTFRQLHIAKRALRSTLNSIRQDWYNYMLRDITQRWAPNRLIAEDI